MMLKNPKQTEGIESGHDAGEPETKIKSGAMPENPKQNEGTRCQRT